MAKAGKFEARIQDFEAEDVRAFYNAHAFRVWHLQGKPRVFKIVKVRQIIERYGPEEKSKAALILAQASGREVRLPFVLNATNRDIIRGLYGNKPAAWSGRLIELYPTTTEFGGKTVDCIRVRTYDPAVRKQAAAGSQVVNGVNWIDPKAQPQQPRQQAPAQGQLDPEDDGRGSGLELDLDALDEVDAAAGNVGANDYQDSNEDDEEPPPGALETDRVIS